MINRALLVFLPIVKDFIRFVRWIDKEFTIQKPESIGYTLGNLWRKGNSRQLKGSQARGERARAQARWGSVRKQAVGDKKDIGDIF
ncbi:hypothetical protein GXB81_14580 [Paraburkholderia sp. Ac-20336]|uniref:hypothetical protein n=1 Tax=Paraburkholderia sp. Ac-20336 TaxID=2703886 RepID=UPI00198074F7|nr:hypothetical protein [Paraburkholderia sp. Ac-20336]MBN3804269.1 hypothetical protein [Paraburkholderia sp. Ac-20336]